MTLGALIKTPRPHLHNKHLYNKYPHKPCNTCIYPYWLNGRRAQFTTHQILNQALEVYYFTHAILQKTTQPKTVFAKLNFNTEIEYHMPHINFAKDTTTPRVEFISQVLTQILITFHHQNLDQESTTKSQPNISISNKLKLVLNLDQIQLQNLDLDSN